MNEELYIKVKQYWANQLSESERIEFEQQMDKDEHFASEVKVYAGMLEAIERKGDELLNEELTTLGKSLLATSSAEESQKKAIVRKFNIPTYVYAIAAAILLLIVVIPFWPKQTIHKGPEDLFVSNFNMPLAPESRDNSQLESRRDSLEFSWKETYRTKDYALTAEYLTELLADTAYTSRSNASYFLGVSQLNMGNAEAAIQAFEQVNEGFELWEEVQWYTALAWLKTGNTAEAKNRFQEIVDSPAMQNTQVPELKDIYEKSQEILENLADN